MWVFILAAKNDAFRAFKKFKFLIENKTEYKIKTLRTDRGSELVSWNSQKQKTLALSSCEAEFMAATTAACHALWLRSLASELTDVKPKPRADVLTKALPGVKLAAMRQLLGGPWKVYGVSRRPPDPTAHGAVVSATVSHVQCDALDRDDACA
ncbi:hypothetical protein ZIOFF_051331 [Zingiber officinale]|uniref:Uncharacterized protein n=1 Tax=Zingiber officinale TaxID=94328 RepID=A0A8J5FLV7_ZINOF|nr:hypothetical protein ZIOFF_051331 [Zingiber officinale]